MANAKRILLVDDDADWLEIGRLTLEAAGYHVACCSDTVEARRAIEEGPPDLVITDLMMHSLDEGFAFARSLKSDPKTRRIPVLLSSGIDRQLGVTFRPGGPEDLAAMGVEAFLPKPVRPPALLSKVAELLGEGPP